jgi:hypothetical protein
MLRKIMEEVLIDMWKLILAFIASISVIGIVTAVLRSCDIEIVAADFSSIALVLGAIFLLLGGIMVYGGVVSLGIFVMLLGLALVVLAIATYGAESY